MTASFFVQPHFLPVTEMLQILGSSIPNLGLIVIGLHLLRMDPAFDQADL